MKLNLDCMRDILICMEDTPFNEILTYKQLLSALPDYSENEIKYSVQKLDEAEFINAIIQSTMTDIYIEGIVDITFKGHQFLADIRSDTIWNDVKETTKKVGADSLHAISQIAVTIITAVINQKLGFS